MISRRLFLGGAAAVATVGVTRIAAAEPPPETAKLILARTNSICQAPQYVAEGLLRSEGFAPFVQPDGLHQWGDRGVLGRFLLGSPITLPTHDTPPRGDKQYHRSRPRRVGSRSTCCPMLSAGR